MDENICSLPKTLFTLNARVFRRKYINKTENPEAAIKPSIGDTTINIRTFSTPAITIAFVPDAIRADPTKPPIKAWLLEEGSPKYQVIKSHIIAPINPERMM